MMDETSRRELAERDARIVALSQTMVYTELSADGSGTAYCVCLYCGDGADTDKDINFAIPDDLALLSDDDPLVRAWLVRLKDRCPHSKECPLSDLPAAARALLDRLAAQEAPCSRLFTHTKTPQR